MLLKSCNNEKLIFLDVSLKKDRKENFNYLFVKIGDVIRQFRYNSLDTMTGIVHILK